MFVEELLNRETLSRYECAEDSTEADSVESVEDRKGQDNGGRQAGEIKSGFDDFDFWLKISDRSRGKVSVGMIGSMQLFARQIPKHIRANPATKYTAFSGRAFGSV